MHDLGILGVSFPENLSNLLQSTYCIQCSEAKIPADLSIRRVGSSSSEATAAFASSVDGSTGSQEPLHNGVVAMRGRTMQWRCTSGTRTDALWKLVFSLLQSWKLKERFRLPFNFD